jgi:hypothetical protein
VEVLAFLWVLGGWIISKPANIRQDEIGNFKSLDTVAGSLFLAFPEKTRNFWRLRLGSVNVANSTEQLYRCI